MLNTIRTTLPASSRDQIYATAGAFVVLLGGIGVVAEEAVALWAGAVVALLALAFAVLHSTSSVRTGLYAVVAALAPLATWYSVGTGQSWAAVVTFAGVLFGTSQAVAHTSTYVGKHRAE